MSTLNVGMVGLDTSHCEAFTKIFHDTSCPHHMGGVKIAGAFPGGSEATAFSYSRCKDITQRMQDEQGVKIFDSIEAMAEGMDAFFLESVDGRQHLDQFEALSRFGKPVFIDKPLTCSYEEAKKIDAIARETSTPVMTASAIRYAKGIADIIEEETEIHACEAFGPMVLPNDYPQFFWYGIHTAEVLFSMMGKGCRSVRTIHQESSDLMIGEWEDGRFGTLRGTRFEGGAFGCTVFTDKGIKNGLAQGDPPYYALMMKDIVPFFQTGKTAISMDESLEIIGFLDAATKSRDQDGATVSL